MRLVAMARRPSPPDNLPGFGQRRGERHSWGDAFLGILVMTALRRREAKTLAFWSRNATTTRLVSITPELAKRAGSNTRLIKLLRKNGRVPGSGHSRQVPSAELSQRMTTESRFYSDK